MKIGDRIVIVKNVDISCPGEKDFIREGEKGTITKIDFQGTQVLMDGRATYDKYYLYKDEFKLEGV